MFDFLPAGSDENIKLRLYGRCVVCVVLYPGRLERPGDRLLEARGGICVVLP